MRTPRLSCLGFSIGSRLYADPFKFVPERWTEEFTARIEKSRQYIFWGYGKHAYALPSLPPPCHQLLIAPVCCVLCRCRGTQYAQALLNRSFIELFRKCELKLVEEPNAPSDRFAPDFAKAVGTPFAKYPIWLSVKPRKDAHFDADSKASA